MKLVEIDALENQTISYLRHMMIMKNDPQAAAVLLAHLRAEKDRIDAWQARQNRDKNQQPVKPNNLSSPTQLPKRPTQTKDDQAPPI